MRIHTSLTPAAFYDAAAEAHVTFDRFTTHGSRSHDRAFDVILSGSSGRHMNSGAYGAMTESEAASWDEWGIFLGQLYVLDEALKGGSYYACAEQFHDDTANRFYYGRGNSGLRWEDQHVNHRWSWNGQMGIDGASFCDSSKRPDCTAIRRHRWLSQQKAWATA